MANPLFDFGMIGLGVMGRNLLLNMADHGFRVIGYDKDPEKGKALESSTLVHYYFYTVHASPYRYSANIAKRVIADQASRQQATSSQYRAHPHHQAPFPG